MDTRPGLDSRWDDLLDDLTAMVGRLEVGGFVTVRAASGLAPDPYAQAVREADGTYFCEVVSALHLPAATWPIDEWALAAAGWDPPVGRFTNWSCEAGTPRQVAAALLDALRFGRLCANPGTLRAVAGGPGPFDLVA